MYVWYMYLGGRIGDCSPMTNTLLLFPGYEQ